MSFIHIRTDIKRGDRVELRGIAGEREFVSMNEAHNILTLKRKGYSENPGSRYSGLKSYYPAEFELYRIDGYRDYGELRVTLIDTFPVRPAKEG